MKGALGFGARYLFLKEIKKINVIKNKIMDISCGYDHVLGLDTNNNVWSFGWNHVGQLSQDPDSDDYSDKQLQKKIRYFIEQKIKILQIASGEHHNLILDLDRNVYSFGCNLYCQRGYQGNDGNVVNKVEVGDVIGIKCGMNYNVVKNKENEYYLWGHNNFNQCLVENI